MTAVVEQKPASVIHSPDHHSDQQPNGFTAVNGRSPPNGAIHSRDSSSGQAMSSYQNGYAHHRESASSTGDKRKHSGSDEYTTAPGPDDHASKRRLSPSTASPNSQFGPPSMNGNTSPQRHQYPPHSSAHHPPSASQPPSSSSSGPEAPQPQYSRQEHYQESREQQPQQQQWGPAPPSHGQGTQQSTQQNGGYGGDQQMAQALQRKNQEMTSPPQHHADPKYPTTPQTMSSPSQGSATQQQQSVPVGMSNMLSVQKQRKRNFSNRTKTGCMTCRERKKKCDEGKPYCNNCVKGGFACKGYQSNSAYKTSSLLAQTPPQNLQARGYEPAHPQPPGYGYGHPPPPPGPHSRGHMPPGPPDYAYPPNGARPGLNPPPSDGNKHPPVAPAQAPMGSGHHPPPPPPPQDYARHGYPEHPRPPYQPEPSREYGHPPSQHYPPPPPGDGYRKDQYTLPHPGSSYPPPAPPSGPQHHNQAPRPPNSSNGSMDARDMATLALQQQAHPPPPGSGNRPPSQYKTEKAKMLNKETYSHQDQQLVGERRECRKALHNFNTSADSVNFSESGRRRFIEHFKEILEPKAVTSPSSPPDATHRKGSVGDRADISTPFNCSYGYNLTIGEDVEFEANVTIDDAAPVKIGNRVILGKNVSIVTSQVDYNTGGPNRKRQFRAYGVTIEDDVIIENNVTILPDVHIERGVVVRAGTVVDKPLQNNTCITRNNDGFRVESIPNRAQPAHWNKPYP